MLYPVKKVEDVFSVGGIGLSFATSVFGKHKMICSFDDPELYRWASRLLEETSILNRDLFASRPMN